MLINTNGRPYRGSTPRSIAMPAPTVPPELPDQSPLDDHQRIEDLEAYVRRLRESIAALTGQYSLIPGDV